MPEMGVPRDARTGTVLAGFSAGRVEIVRFDTCREV